VKSMREQYHRRRDLVVGRLNAAGLACRSPGRGVLRVPERGLDGAHERDFAYGLLESQSVAVVPGTAFGENGRGFVRASFATGYDQLVEACDRIERFVNTATHVPLRRHRRPAQCRQEPALQPARPQADLHRPRPARRDARRHLGRGRRRLHAHGHGRPRPQGGRDLLRGDHRGLGEAGRLRDRHGVAHPLHHRRPRPGDGARRPDRGAPEARRQARDPRRQQGRLRRREGGPEGVARLGLGEPICVSAEHGRGESSCARRSSTGSGAAPGAPEAARVRGGAPGQSGRPAPSASASSAGRTSGSPRSPTGSSRATG
jgi:hypothetical protein